LSEQKKNNCRTFEKYPRWKTMLNFLKNGTDGNLCHPPRGILQHHAVIFMYCHFAKNKRITVMDILKFTVHKTACEDYYFRLRNIDGSVLITSREYTSLRKCFNEIYCLQIHQYMLEQGKIACNKYRITFKSQWGMVIGQGPVYVSERRMLQDVQLIEASIYEAEVEDRSATVRFFRAVSTKI
jgi:uncharacterized protein YegP (UPF0339 family)